MREIKSWEPTCSKCSNPMKPVAGHPGAGYDPFYRKFHCPNCGLTLYRIIASTRLRKIIDEQPGVAKN